ncbi:alanine/glycine:cation symporter family protein [Porcipelethomonas sp.]|uniref:alanine/glycine:cation symporter family protein n=1 Tax=Porcipelethomonas sp. TaxID=2981675 RepID=UPI003EFAD764
MSESLLEKINNFVWSDFLLIFLLGTGLFFSIKLKFFQFFKIKYIFKNTIFLLFRDKSAVKTTDKNSISQFQALSTALAATMGTGNIAGVATAITIGGPGAVFWMWISAFLGMALVYAENYLGTVFRRKHDGCWAGGPMAYLENGAGKKYLAVLFAAFCALASLGMGNMTQVNSISTSLNDSFGIPVKLTGIIAAVLTLIIISGGIKRIGKASQYLIPVLSGVYIIGAVIIIIKNSVNIPETFRLIFTDAFGIRAAGGGICGAILKKSINTGLRRGVFSNEAGLGSSALLHSASDNTDPHKQGLWAVSEVFIDTIICCTLTALAILTSGAVSSGKDGVPLVTEAFRTVMGDFAPVFISVSVSLFAFATLISWFYCGECSVRYLFGNSGIPFYKFIFIFSVIIGAAAELKAVWTVSDIFNGLMAIPNLAGLIILRKNVKGE